MVLIGIGLVLLGACSLFFLRLHPAEDYRTRPIWVARRMARQWWWSAVGSILATAGLGFCIAGSPWWVSPFYLLGVFGSGMNLSRSLSHRRIALEAAQAMEDAVVDDTIIPESPQGL